MFSFCCFNLLFRCDMLLSWRNVFPDRELNSGLVGECHKSWPLDYFVAGGKISCFCSHELREWFRAWKWSSIFIFSGTQLCISIEFRYHLCERKNSQTGSWAQVSWLEATNPKRYSIWESIGRLSSVIVSTRREVELYKGLVSVVLNSFFCFCHEEFFPDRDLSPGLVDESQKSWSLKHLGVRGMIFVLFPWAQRMVRSSKLEFKFSFFLLRSLAFRLKIHFIIVRKKFPDRELDPIIVGESEYSKGRLSGVIESTRREV